jgi:hypothetical protein
MTEDQYDELLDFYISADTRRYHNKRGIPIQTVKEHSFGMLLLLLKLHPNPSANLMRAIIEHDLPETDGYWMDAPHDLKEKYPILREIEDIQEKKFRARFNLTENKLTEVEKLWLKYLDGLEVICYIEVNIPEPNPQSQEIYNRQMEKTTAIEQQLKAFGFFTEPDIKNLQ